MDGDGKPVRDHHDGEESLVPSQEFERGLRFLHLLAMQLKQDLYDTVTQVSSLIDAMTEKGLIDKAGLEARYDGSRQREFERIRTHAVVQIADPNQRETEVSGETIDCSSLIHLCKARCCTFDVTLSAEDLDAGVIRWDYGQPYRIRSAANGYCVHSCGGDGGGCTAYEYRPKACKTYDCRSDERIWIDFENRIPAPSDR